MAEMKLLDKTEQSDRASNPNEKPQSCYCSALPKGSGLCLGLATERQRQQPTFITASISLTPQTASSWRTITK